MTISPVAPSAQPAGTSAGTSAAAAGLGALFAGFLGAGTAAPGSVSGPTPGPTTGPTPGPTPDPTIGALGDPTADLVDDPAVTDADAEPEQPIDLGELDEAGRESSAPTIPVELTSVPSHHGTEPSPGSEPLAGDHPVVEVLSAAQIMAAAQVVPVTPVLAAALALSSGVPTAAPTSPTVSPAPTGSTAVSAGHPVPPTVPSSAVPLAAPAVPESTHGAAAMTGPTVDTTSGTAPEPGPVAVPEGARAASGDEQAVPTTTQQHDSRPDPGAAGRRQPEQSAGPEPVNTQVGLSGATAPPAAGRPEAPTPAAAAQVTGQVFPEVSRLVSRGDGTQRITLKLSPEALGDVRVVLTVRDGDVQVRMVGSEQAQQALRAGAPELQRLLDLAGASSSQIIVGDQSSSPGAGHGTDTGPGTDRDTDHRTAGTRDGDTSARDGAPGGPQKRPSIHPTATRGGASTGMSALSGVDMTM